MATNVTLPQLGESVSEGTVTTLAVKEGDVVKKDQVLLTVATDKTDSDIPAPVAGRILKIHAKEGETLPVNALLLEIEEGVFESASATPAAAAPAPAAGTNLATPSARRSALENNVDLAGVQGSGDGGRIVKSDIERAAAPVPAASAAAVAAPAMPQARAAQVASMINTSGFVPPIPGVGFGSFKLAPYRETPGDQVIPFTRRRRITADHMTYSKFSSPHVVAVAEVDLHKTSKLREAHKDRYKKEGLSLTMLAFVAQAASRALRETPSLNARVLDDAYVLYKDINLGIAVDSPEGLVVPVVRRADELGVRGLVRGIDDLAKRAKTSKITIDDLAGATFSITNPGLKGNLFGGAVINQPNVGILRMGEIQKRVVVITDANGEDSMVIHPVMYLALSYDHRIVDGVAANSFLWRVTELLERGEFEV